MAMFQPVGDRVLVRPPDRQTVSDGGIHLPETAAQDKPQQGVVLATGPGRRLEDGTLVPMQVKPGQKIVFGAYAGVEFKAGKEDFVIMHEDDILMFEVEENANAQDAGG